MAHISPTEASEEEGAMVWYDEASDFFLLDCAEGMMQNEGKLLEKRRRRALGTRNN